MDRAKILASIEFSLSIKLEEAKAAAKNAHEDATHEQNIAETQYDSLSIESAYLAHGQSERVNQTYLSITQFESIFKLPVSEHIQVGSIVELEDQNANVMLFFIGPCEGGLVVQCGSENIMVITAQSPIGQKLIAKYAGDNCVFMHNGNEQFYEIKRVF